MFMLPEISSVHGPGRYISGKFCVHIIFAWLRACITASEFWKKPKLTCWCGMLWLLVHTVKKNDPGSQFRVNSSPPSAAYMRRWTGSALVQIMACRLDGAKPLSEPMLTYCELDPKEHISMKFYFESNIFIEENSCEHVVCEMMQVDQRLINVVLGKRGENEQHLSHSISFRKHK